MVDYFDAFGTATPDLKQRAVGVQVVGDGTYAPGESVTVNLSSLDFSRNEPAAGTVVGPLRPGSSSPRRQSTVRTPPRWTRSARPP